MLYRLAADGVAGIHLAWVLIVLLGLVLILVGAARGWAWVRSPWWRGLHLGMILLVIARATLWSDECPLTTWERDLRSLGGQENYEGSPVGWFLHAVIHPPLPTAVFPVIYIAFGTLVLATFWFVPIRWQSSESETESALSSETPQVGPFPSSD
jgi:hypothetical protein